MAHHPHLSFLPPVSATLDKLPGGGSKPITPPLTSQLNRFSNKFTQLTRQFAEQVQITSSIDGLRPEKVLVIEIAGSIKNFTNALQKVPGFSNIQHLLYDDEVEDDVIFYEKSKGQREPARKEVYLTMSNQDGLRRLLSHWNNMSSTGKADRGLAPLKDALSQLHDMRFWDTQDRIKKTGLLEDWRERIEFPFDERPDLVPFEIELWFSNSVLQQQEVERAIRLLINNEGGSITGVYRHDGIAYHALRGELPIAKVQEVIEKGAEYLSLMRCDEVMYFRPLGQCGFTLDSDLDDLPEEEINELADIEVGTKSVVALLDGLPLANHAALVKHIIIDDPDDFSSMYNEPSEHLHGTAMSSLIIHGDGYTNNRSLETPLYVRPILAPGRPNLKGKRLECIPEGVLPLDLIHRAVKRMFDGEPGVLPTAPDVKAINLSVCDPKQLFDRNMSPWARMLDWLSYKYDVLFIVSAGNHIEDIEFNITNGEFGLLSTADKEKLFIEKLNASRWEKRLMAPAESINAVTVKATHHDNFSDQLAANIVDPFETKLMFSPVNPISLGKFNSIKPELMAPGGRVTYRNMAYIDSAPLVLSPISTPKPFGPGQKVATPGTNLGAINSFAFSYGTSNAAALTTRRIAMLHETVSSMKKFHPEALEQAAESLILKALIVHGAEVPLPAKNRIVEILKREHNSRTFKDDEGQYFGYGHLNEERIHSCTSNQATLIYTGSVKLDNSDLYHFPLPPCLAGSIEERRMIVTLAWFSPINPLHDEYRQAQMWVSDPKNSKLNFDEGDYYHHHQKKGTVFHHVVRGDRASNYLNDKDVLLKVNCKARAGASNLDIPYALVVTLETTNPNLPIYEEVKNILEQRIEQSLTEKSNKINV